MFPHMLRSVHPWVLVGVKEFKNDYYSRVVRFFFRFAEEYKFDNVLEVRVHGAKAWMLMA